MRSFTLATAATPGSEATFAASDSGSSERVKSVTSDWYRPKSAPPTWVRSFAVLCTPLVIERSATIRPTPSPTPTAVKTVRAGRRSRFFQMSAGHVIHG
jgi:hypothetical protein